MWLALHNLAQDRLRLALSVLSVALAVMLILFLLGLRRGVSRAAVTYLDHTPGAVVVLPQGGRGTAAGSARFLPQGAVDAVARTPGVARVTPLLLVMAMPEFHGRKEAVKLVGYDAALGGGPWDLAQGRAPLADGEVVLDRVLADRHDFDVGGSLTLGGLQLTVVGLANGTSSWTGSYLFARKSSVESLVLAPGATNLALVTAAPAITPTELVARLQTVPGTSVLLKRAVTANDQQIVAGIADQVIILMVVAAFVVGALVVGMVISTATLERRGEYGILKAIGARNGVIYRVVVWQALIAAGAGALLETGLAFAMGRLVMIARPQFLVEIEPPAIIGTLAAGLMMALAGGLVPARAAARLAPAEVFRR